MKRLKKLIDLIFKNTEIRKYQSILSYFYQSTKIFSDNYSSISYNSPIT